MEFALIKDFEGLDMYGYIPETFGATFEQVEIYKGDWDDGMMLCEKLLPLMYEYMDGVLLDLSDVDYFDKEKCVKLNVILEKQIPLLPPSRLKELYTVLNDYTKRAIDLNTGVVIEL